MNQQIQTIECVLEDSNSRVELNGHNFVDAGAEGRVHKINSFAYKVFHLEVGNPQMGTGLPIRLPSYYGYLDGYTKTLKRKQEYQKQDRDVQQKLLSQLDQYKEKLIVRRKKIPALMRLAGLKESDKIALPTDLLRSAKNGNPIVGYQMPWIKGDPLREFLAVANVPHSPERMRAAVRMFSDLYSAMVKLHKRDVVIGDLSADNVLYRTKHKPSHAEAFFIDVDSFGLPNEGYPCTVGNIIWSDPKRFDDTVATPESDRYAFAALFFFALMGAHPRAGTAKGAAKKRLARDYQGRCEQGVDDWWVFSSNANRPQRLCLPKDVLVPELFDWFETCFTTQKRPLLGTGVKDDEARIFNDQICKSVYLDDSVFDIT